MPRNQPRKLRRFKPRRGGNLVVLAGLPRDSLEWVKSTLSADKSRKAARYVGAPSTLNDRKSLYGRRNIAKTLELIERESQAYTPHRIIVLYVPSHGAEDLFSALGYVCFLAPLHSQASARSGCKTSLAWRHKKPEVKTVVYQTLNRALGATNALKAEITDRRISPFTLPSRNFYYPDNSSTISVAYQAFMRHGFCIQDLRAKLVPSRFTRSQLPQKAFKGGQYSGLFFQDRRKRVFPPDVYHAMVTPSLPDAPGATLSLALQQWFRFGVTVRDGNLHYDLQYELPRKLRNEPMYCAADGAISVTGSHANVGVNDVVWAPGGRKEPLKN